MTTTEQMPVSFRANAREVEALRWLARKENRSVSNMLRQLVHEAAKERGAPGWQENEEE